MIRPRVLPRELLDALPAESREARAARRDLRVFNRLLGSESWLAAVVAGELKPGERVLELGAGDGEIARTMLRRGLPWDALDRIAAPENWPAGAGWIQADALKNDPQPGHRVIVANLLFHHFDAGSLAALGARLRPAARVIVASDLVRSAVRARLFGALCRLMGAHPVSRHDGVLSIRAGFRGTELPAALGLAEPAWRCEIQATLTGAYRMLAVKRS